MNEVNLINSLDEIKIKYHKFADDFVDHRDTPNKGGEISPNVLVIHHTAGRMDKYNSVNWMCNPRSKASAHLCIEHDGTTTQLVPFNKKAWHAGTSRYRGKKWVNNNSIGIELVNPGRLTEDGTSWFGQNFAQSDLHFIKSKTHGDYTWLPYSQAQINNTFRLCEAIVDKYPTITNVVGHFEISRGKTDVSPIFPIEELKSLLFGRADSQDNYDGETLVRLNARTVPSVSDSVVLTTLPRQAKVDIIKQKIVDGDVWFLVELEEHTNSQHDAGWIHGDYVEPY